MMMHIAVVQEESNAMEHLMTEFLNECLLIDGKEQKRMSVLVR